MRILFISCSHIGDNNPTGQTLQSLFEGIEDIDILQLILSPPNKKDFRYQTIYSTWNESLLNYFITKYHNTVSKRASTSKSTALSSSFRSRLLFSIKQFILRISDICGIRLSRKTYAEIMKFKPDVIYTLGGSVFVCELCCKMSKKLKIPVVMHSMDDHIHTKYQTAAFLDKGLRKRFMNATKEIYNGAKIGMAIGPKMAEEYETEFGVPFSWAMNCINSIHYEPIKQFNPIKLVFSGGVHGGRDVILAHLFDFLFQYNQSRDIKVLLEIYTNPQGMSQLKKYENEYSRVYDYVPKDKMFDNLSQATLLLHVESFENYYQEYFRLSMSTKIPEYLSVGRPVMFIGPDNTGTGEYLKSMAVSFNVSSIEECGQVFDNLNPEKILTMCKQAVSLAQRNHTNKETQKIIKSVFKSAIENYNSQFL